MDMKVNNVDNALLNETGLYIGFSTSAGLEVMSSFTGTENTAFLSEYAIGTAAFMSLESVLNCSGNLPESYSFSRDIYTCLLGQIIISSPNNQYNQYGFADKISHQLSIFDTYINLCVKDNTYLSSDNLNRLLCLFGIVAPSIPRQTVFFEMPDNGNDLPKLMNFPQYSYNDGSIEKALNMLNSWEQERKIVPQISYSISSLVDLCLATLSYIASNRLLIKKCVHCGKRFVPLGRSDTLYCDYSSPEMPSKTCREFVPYQKWQEKERGDESRVLYKQIYNQLNNKMRRWMKRDTELSSKFWVALDAFLTSSVEWQDSIKNGTRKHIEYIEWLKTVKSNCGFVPDSITKGGADDGNSPTER